MRKYRRDMKLEQKSTDKLTSLDPDKIYEKLIEAGLDWADKHSAAELEEEMKKSILADMKNKSSEKSEAGKERDALGSVEYREFLLTMVQARFEANKAKVKYDSIKVWIELKRTTESTKRAEMKLT